MGHVRMPCEESVARTSFGTALRWAYTGSWGERGFSALFTFVLAAVLGPRDFGTVGIAVVYISFLQMFLDQGFVAALIQKRDLEPEHLDVVFWVDVVLSVVLVGVSLMLGGWWAARNHAHDAAKLISVLSVCVPIQGLATVQVAILSRNMDFRALAIRGNMAVVVSGAIGIVMVLTGFRVWALVWQQIIRDVIALTLLWKLSPWRPRLGFSWRHLRDLAGFSISNFIAQLGIFAEAQSSSILLGLLFGPVAVGLYRLADRLVATVVAMATASIQAVSLPEFARVHRDPDRLRKSVLLCIRVSSTATLPILCGMAAVSPAMLAVLGPKWIAASGALRVLCVVGMSTVFACFTGPLLQARSRPHHLAALEWSRTAVGTTCVVVAGLLVQSRPAETQLVGIALARFVTMTCLVAPIFLGILMHLADISFRGLMSAVAPSALASLSTLAAVALFQFSGCFASGKPLVLLIAETATGGIAGLAVLLALDTKLYGLIKSLPQKMFRPPAESRA